MAPRSSPLSSGPQSHSGPDDVSRGSARQHASYLAEMRRNDRAQRDYYESKMRSEGIDPTTGTPLRPPAPSGPLPYEPKIRDAFSSSPGGTIAGTVLGGLAYFLGLAWVRGGSAGAKNWVKAKFINVTPSSTTSLPAGTAKNTNTTTAGSTAKAPATGALA